MILLEYWTGCWFFLWLDLENAGVVSEHLCFFGKQARKYAGFVVIFVHYWILGTVHKHIFTRWMSMEINKHKEIGSIFFLVFYYQLFEKINLRKQSSIRVNVFSIKIFTREPSSIITETDSIRIEHGYNFELNFTTEIFSCCFIRAEKINETLHHVRSIGLTRMHSATNYYAFFLRFRRRAWWRRSNIHLWEQARLLFYC